MHVTNRSPRLLSIAASGHGLGVLLLVPLDRVEVPPELEQAVRAALEGPLRTFVAKGELDIEDAPPAAAPAHELEPPPAAELEPQDAAIASVDYANAELEAVPEPAPVATRTVSRGKPR
jgi:hypothetical protein